MEEIKKGRAQSHETRSSNNTKRRTSKKRLSRSKSESSHHHLISAGDLQTSNVSTSQPAPKCSEAEAVLDGEGHLSISLIHEMEPCAPDEANKRHRRVSQRRSSTPMPADCTKTEGKGNAKEMKQSKDTTVKKRLSKKRTNQKIESQRHKKEATSRVDKEIASFITTAFDVDMESKLPLKPISSSHKEEKKREKSNRDEKVKKSKLRHAVTPRKKSIKSKKKTPPPIDMNSKEEADSKPGLETNVTLKLDEEMSSFITSALQRNEVCVTTSDTVPIDDKQQQEADIPLNKTPEPQRKKKTTQISCKKRKSLSSNIKRTSTITTEKKPNAKLQYCPAEMDDEAIARTVQRFPIKDSVRLFIASQIEMPGIKPRHRASRSSYTTKEVDMMYNTQNSCTAKPGGIMSRMNHALCNSIASDESAKIVEKEDSYKPSGIVTDPVQIPPFFPADHITNRRMLDFLKMVPKSDLFPRIDCAPHFFHSVYFAVPDNQSLSTPAFNRRATLYLNAQGICAYFGYSLMLNFLLSTHEINNCSIKAHEPCFVAGIHETSEFGDLMVISPACLALRRGNGPILNNFMKRGWSIHNTVRIYYRRIFGDQDYIYNDGIDYLLEVACEKPGHDLKSIFKALIYGSHSNFQIHTYRIIERKVGSYENICDNVSIPRRLLRHLSRANALNNGFSILSSVMLFVDGKTFEVASECNDKIEISAQRLDALIQRMEAGSQESARAFDQDCTLALCFGLMQLIRDMGVKAKIAVRELLLELILRILIQTQWIVEFSSCPPRTLKEYFNMLEEEVIIESDTFAVVQRTIPRLIRENQHSIGKDIINNRVHDWIQSLDPSFNLPIQFRSSSSNRLPSDSGVPRPQPPPDTQAREQPFLVSL